MIDKNQEEYKPKNHGASMRRTFYSFTSGAIFSAKYRVLILVIHIRIFPEGRAKLTSLKAITFPMQILR